jgi:predicted porin
MMAAALAASPAQAQESRDEGLVLSVAAGRSDYALDCLAAFVCTQPSATSFKLGVGYQFGIWGIEAAYINFGRSEAFDSFGSQTPSDRVQIQAAVVDAAWRWRLGSLEMALRAGVAGVQHQRSGETNTRRVSPHLGLGLGWALTPALTLELAWDATRGKSSGGYTTTVNANSLALRVRL